MARFDAQLEEQIESLPSQLGSDGESPDASSDAGSNQEPSDSLEVGSEDSLLFSDDESEELVVAKPIIPIKKRFVEAP